MNESKPWYASRTVWGALVAIGAAILGFWNFEVPQVEQERVVEMIVQIMGALGGLTALVGRLTATRVIAGR